MARSRGGRGGVLVNVSSGAATLGSPGEYVHYAAAKAGVDALTVGLAQEVAADGVRVVGVAPGIVETRIHEDAGRARPGRAGRAAGAAGPRRPAGRGRRGGRLAALRRGVVRHGDDAAGRRRPLRREPGPSSRRGSGQPARDRCHCRSRQVRVRRKVSSCESSARCSGSPPSCSSPPDTAACRPGGRRSARSLRRRGARCRVTRQRDPARRPTLRVRPQGRGPRSAGELEMPTSYPYQPELRVYPPNVPDASDSGEPALATTTSPRSSTSGWRRATGSPRRSSASRPQGRDLYLVTLTAPEHRRRDRRSRRAWREEIRDDPTARRATAALPRDYKPPIWFSANIHGNEWEGTDASMQVIEDLVEAPWPRGPRPAARTTASTSR